MFGRRKREEEAAAEAAREAERRALFTRLAERPEHICPFLGLASERTEYVEGISDEHRCFAFGDPAPISAEQQTRVCQERGYGNCPRYLRGVLVIPTEELEALRRPQAPLPETPPPPPPTDRRRVPGVVFLLLLLLVGAGGVGAFLLFGGDDGIAVASPTPTLPPTPSVTPSPEPSPTATASPTPAPTPTPNPTPVVLPSAGETIPPLPTPPANSEFTGWIIAVTAGEFPVVRITSDGEVGDTTRTIFSRVSGAPVDRLEIDDTIYWVTLAGVYTNLAYVDEFSGGPEDFQIYETWTAPDGQTGFLLVPEGER